MSFTIKITVEVIDPTDPDYIATNEAVVDMSEQFGYQRRMAYGGHKEVGIFTFPSLENVMAFRNHPIHRAAMTKVDKFYRSMQVERSWRD